MQIKQRDIFTTIHVEGAILPPDLLQRIVSGDSGLDGLTPESYHLVGGEKINEAVNRAWNRLQGAWLSFREQREKLAKDDPATSLTRERWLLPLFRELDYGRLPLSRAIEIENRSYPISHFWQKTPIHLVGCGVDMEKRMPGVSGAARSSPHSMVQEFLNRSDEYLWGLVSNGLKLRILRDNLSLTRQAYVEFDLEAMMEGEVYADFVLLWLLCHQSRVEAERPEECWLEKWSNSAREQGTRALDQLRKGVEEAIAALGKGFISHPANQALKQALRSGELDKQEFYRQLLRLVYRLIFLFVAEDRQLLLKPDADTQAKETYTRFYSTARLRRLAYKQRGSRHSDLFHGLRLVMHKLGSDSGCPELALPALGSFLFSERAIADIEFLELGNRFLLDALRSLAFITEGNTRRPVDYKNLGSEELGSVYESLLELHPELDITAGVFELKTAGGHERKTTGSYYTPSSLIQCLLDSALDPVLEEAAKQLDPEQAILNLKICDPACGSGHFLIAAAHRLAHRLAAIRSGEGEPPPEALRSALRDVIGHCIYGVDINEMAVELCKVGLWMEALEPGKPLSFLDHRIQCGNSLLGATPALLDKGIPDDAFKPIEGDDKKLCSEYKKQNKKERETRQLSFFDAAGQPWMRLGDQAAALLNLDAVDDSTIEGIEEKQRRYREMIHSQSYEYNRLRADAWCAAFVWKKTPPASPGHSREGGNPQMIDSPDKPGNDKYGDLPYPVTEEVYRNLEKNPFSLPKWMKEEIRRLANQYRLFHWHLAFPDVFRLPAKDKKPENEHTGWSGGFDVMLGNPPWERIKLQEKEWFAERRPEIANAPNAAARRRMIAALAQEDPALYRAFLEDRRKAEGESTLVRDTGVYPLCGRGDVNTYAVFAELKRNLINTRGAVGCIVPSGIATDDTTKFFFRDLMETSTLISLYDFENRKAIFEGVHRSYKFCLLTMNGKKRPQKLVPSEEGSGADFVFFAHDVANLREPESHFALTAEDIALLNPNTRTCPIFRSRQDAELTKHIYKRVPVLIKESPPEENPWGVTLLRMFDMSNDSHLFKTMEQLQEMGFEMQGNVFVNGNDRWMPVYEGKMVSMYDHRAANIELRLDNPSRQQQPVLSSRNDHLSPNFSNLPYLWGPEIEGDNRIPNYWNKLWFPTFKRVTASTNERTIVGCIVPKTTVSYTLYLVFCDQDFQTEILGLTANLYSFVADYIVRQKTAQPSLPIGVVNESAFQPPGIYKLNATWDYDKNLRVWITERVLELTYTAWDLEPFAKDCGYDGPPFKWDEERRFLLRCELDAAYFHLYLGAEQEWREQGSPELLQYFPIPRAAVEYIMETFPIVKRKDEQKYGEYRTKRVILEIYDEMAEAMRSGAPYQTRLDPPPADPRAAHPGRGE